MNFKIYLSFATVGLFGLQEQITLLLILLNVFLTFFQLISFSTFIGSVRAAGGICRLLLHLRVPAPAELDDPVAGGSLQTPRLVEQVAGAVQPPDGAVAGCRPASNFALCPQVRLDDHDRILGGHFRHFRARHRNLETFLPEAGQTRRRCSAGRRHLSTTSAPVTWELLQRLV